MKKKAVQTERIDIRVTPEDKEILRAVAYIKRMTITDFVRERSLRSARWTVYGRLNEDFNKLFDIPYNELTEEQKKLEKLIGSSEGNPIILESLKKWKEEEKKKEEEATEKFVDEKMKEVDEILKKYKGVKKVDEMKKELYETVKKLGEPSKWFREP
jgi:anion-transporting  ArsA/GET3 family ATPase